MRENLKYKECNGCNVALDIVHKDGKDFYEVSVEYHGNSTHDFSVEHLDRRNADIDFEYFSK